MSEKTLIVCYFGTYRANYSRNQVMIAGLRANQVEVIECHVTFWRGIEDRVRATRGGWLRPRFWWRVLRTYLRLLQKHHQVGAYDVLMVGYPGQFDVFLARLLSWWRRKPLVWDVFMSISLIAMERDLHHRSPTTIRLLRWVESLALRLPNILIQDTGEYVKWFQTTYGISPKRFRLVPTGADDRIFHPPPNPPEGKDSRFLVVYYGTFIPNHGTKYIAEAARLLKDEKDIHFLMIGDGPELASIQQMVKQHHLTNITFLHWMEKNELVHRVSQADVCLGAFGSTPQSLITVQNKIYEGLAMGKPVLTGDGPAVRTSLVHGQHVYLVKRTSGAAIAAGIRALKENPTLREHIARQGYRVFQDRYSLKALGKLVAQYLEEVYHGK